MRGPAAAYGIGSTLVAGAGREIVGIVVVVALLLAKKTNAKKMRPPRKLCRWKTAAYLGRIWTNNVVLVHKRADKPHPRQSQPTLFQLEKRLDDFTPQHRAWGRRRNRRTARCLTSDLGPRSPAEPSESQALPTLANSRDRTTNTERPPRNRDTTVPKCRRRRRPCSPELATPPQQP